MKETFIVEIKYVVNAENADAMKSAKGAICKNLNHEVTCAMVDKKDNVVAYSFKSVGKGKIKA